MLERALQPTLKRLAKHFPVVAVTGPRQSGKTTLVRKIFSKHAYVSLEDPSERAFALEDPKGFLKRFEQGAIFDEAQRWPDLFSHLQGMVDADRRPGRFILTGSQQFGLLAGISQSLAGRVGMTQLLPFSLAELAPLKKPLDYFLLHGGYPSLHTTSMVPNDWFASYVATYIERDVRQLLQVQDLSTFQRFLRLCAGRTGQLLNMNSIAVEVGISHATVRSWISVLEASHIIFLLTPYHRNFGKRLVKMPKLYFIDVGLAAWLLGIRSEEVLVTHPLRGALFETLIVSEFLKTKCNQGLPTDLYFWRDNNGREVDLIFEHEKSLQLVEIKSGQTVTSDMIKSEKKMLEIVDSKNVMEHLVYGGEESYQRSGLHVWSWRDRFVR